ncbi:fatty acid synthase Fas [Mycobacteroides abscessus subsp. abscessus]|nr:fatty acid synthase Fas [Mycobacteroides abscessus subsp. abscessus]
MCGGEPAYRRPSGRRLDSTLDEHDAEAGLLLDPGARLTTDGAYGVAADGR